MRTEYCRTPTGGEKLEELERLYQLLELPASVVQELEAYGEHRNHVDWGDIKEMLLHRESWEEGIKRMQESIGDDANGIKILWENVAVFCESWLLSPVLQEILDDNSNIIHFQKLFLVENTDYDSMAVLDWVFPGYHYVSEQLPEGTSLQRKMKEYLLQGKKIGWSRGRLDESVFHKEASYERITHI